MCPKVLVNFRYNRITMLPVIIYSAETLQKWHFDTPFETGIGGSETAHIELHSELENLGVEVYSLVPLPDDYYATTRVDRSSIKNLRSLLDALEHRAILINFRDSSLYSKMKFKKTVKHYFVAQDTNYAWPGDKVPACISKYITLCKDHTNFTLTIHPELKGRVYQSSNGVRAKMIEKYWKKNIKRDAHQIIYASSPDRGLILLLQQFWRIRERVPTATLKIAYGFENTEKIIALSNGSAYHEGFRDQVKRLLVQPGVEFLGRIPQDKLYEEWFKSNVWAYPCNFAETSCITCLDAQACGTAVVCNDLWALRDNVNPEHQTVFKGSIQDDILLRTYFIEEIIYQLNNPKSKKDRKEHAKLVYEKYDWKNIAKQYKGWIENETE